MTGPVLAFDDVVVEFGAVRVLDEVSLAIADRGITVLVGPSGSGKSTLLRLANRLEVPTAGTVRFRGTVLDDLDPLVLRRQVGMVFQRPVLFPGTVRANLAVAGTLGVSPPDAALDAALDRVGLPGAWLDRTGDDLSGGEAQRLCLARTLLTEPSALLLDEPTSSLDHAATGRLERLARAVASDGIPVVWVTHDLAQAERLADETVVLLDGRVASPDAARAFRAGPTEDEVHGA